MPPTPSQLKAAFTIFDTDGSGTLSADELKAILTRSVRGGAPLLSSERVDGLIAEFDTNGDGVLSLDEFVKAWAGVEAKATLGELMALVDAPAGETFSDLVPAGAGCEIAKTEMRAIRLVQLLAIKKHVERRCAAEGWLDYQGTPLAPERASLYEVCRHVIKPATLEKQTSYVELIATEPQKPIWFVSHWWGEAIFEFVWCIDQHSKDHTKKDQWGTVINKEAVETCGYWVCAYGASPSVYAVATRRC